MDFDSAASRRTEAMYLTRDLAAVRRTTIDALDLTPGARVLDVGSGPGLFAQEIAPLVGPRGAVCGVDTSEAMLAMARARCAGLGQVEFRLADAAALPFAAGEFDACVCVQVLEFVEDASAALREMWRVLRPGGRVALVDTDWGTTAWSCADETLCARVMEGWRAGFAYPRLPGNLAPMLVDAGFRAPSVQVIPIVDFACEADAYSFHLIGQIQGVVPQKTDVAQKDADAWAADVRAGDYFFAQSRYLFVAEKPA